METWKTILVFLVLPATTLKLSMAKAKIRRYPARTITDADYTDYGAILANTPTQALSLLHSLERAANGIGFHANADKAEYTCFNQRPDISTLKGGPLKLVDYLGSSISSTENDMNTGVAKAWTAIDKLSVIWNSDLSDKIKRSFFPNSGCINIAKWMHHLGARQAFREKAWRKLH